MYYAIKSTVTNTPEGKRKNIKYENWYPGEKLEFRRRHTGRNDEITIYFFKKKMYDLHFFTDPASQSLSADDWPLHRVCDEADDNLK